VRARMRIPKLWSSIRRSLSEPGFSWDGASQGVVAEGSKAGEMRETSTS
jgi:hypothetical protein